MYAGPAVLPLFLLTALSLCASGVSRFVSTRWLNVGHMTNTYVDYCPDESERADSSSSQARARAPTYNAYTPQIVLLN